MRVHYSTYDNAIYRNTHFQWKLVMALGKALKLPGTHEYTRWTDNERSLLIELNPVY